MRYSASTGGFYPEGSHYPNLPLDLVTIDQMEYDRLMVGTFDRKSIVPNSSGYPVLVEQIETPTQVTTVTMRQAKLALYDAGILKDLQAYISAMPAPERGRAEIEMEAATWERSSPLVQAIGDALEWDLDALFTAAAAIK